MKPPVEQPMSAQVYPGVHRCAEQTGFKFIAATTDKPLGGLTAIAQAGSTSVPALSQTRFAT